MITLAVIGPGAIGGTLAAWLAQVPGHDVTICARTRFGHLVVDVPGGRTLRLAPKVLTDPSRAAPVDWVIAVTKTYDTEGASLWLPHLVGPETRVAVVQNGVEHMSRFPTLVQRDRLLPVIIDIPAERSSPGHILQRRNGDITVPAGELGDRFVALFAGTELTPKTTDDFVSAAWRKLVLNSASVVNALTERPAGVVRDPHVATLMRAIVAEALTVGRAVGARLDDGLPDEVIARYRAMPPDQTNSLLADRLARRRLEIDARSGVIVREGKARGLLTPLTEMAVTLLEASMP
jgi:2-dehydropantoate 2-reductase